MRTFQCNRAYYRRMGGGACIFYKTHLQRMLALISISETVCFKYLSMQMFSKLSDSTFSIYNPYHTICTHIKQTKLSLTHPHTVAPSAHLCALQDNTVLVHIQLANCRSCHTQLQVEVLHLSHHSDQHPHQCGPPHSHRAVHRICCSLLLQQTNASISLPPRERLLVQQGQNKVVRQGSMVSAQFGNHSSTYGCHWLLEPRVQVSEPDSSSSNSACQCCQQYLTPGLLHRWGHCTRPRS